MRKEGIEGQRPPRFAFRHSTEERNKRVNKKTSHMEKERRREEEERRGKTIPREGHGIDRGVNDDLCVGNELASLVNR
jgi:hypothetical protein